MEFQTSKQSILVSIFCLGLLRLLAGTYKATASTAANVVTSQSFGTNLTHVRSVWGMFGKRFPLV